MADDLLNNVPMILRPMLKSALKGTHIKFDTEKESVIVTKNGEETVCKFSDIEAAINDE